MGPAGTADKVTPMFSKLITDQIQLSDAARAKMKELVDGEVMMIPGRKKVAGETVQLRLIITADSYIAQYRTDPQSD